MRQHDLPCHIMLLADDLLCNLVVPDSRVLLMARTCKRIRNVLERGRCAVDVRVKKKVRYDKHLAKLFSVGLNNIQFNYMIRRFECCASMHNVQLNFGDCEELAFIHLRTLTMHANQISELNMLSLFYMLSFSSDMRSFEFTQQSLKCRQVPWLTHCVSRFARLETLNLDKNYFVFDSLGLVLDVLQTTTLSTLNLCSNSCEDADKMLKLCRVINTNCTALKVLNLSFMRLHESFESLLQALSTCTFLQSLDLSKNHLKYERLTAVLNATSGCHMQSFNWSSNSFGCDNNNCSPGTYILADHISNNDNWNMNLLELKISSCFMRDMEYLGEALVKCKRLATLDVANNSVYGHELAPILMCESITSLNINNNYISDYGMQLVLQRTQRNKSLTDMHVLGNHISMNTLRQFRRLRKRRKMTGCMPRTSCPCSICSQIDNPFIFDF